MPGKEIASGAATFMDPALMPWALISELYWMSYKLLERRMYYLGVGASQARVLTVLHYAAEPLKPSLIATLLFQETQSITGILQRVESKGWVVRTPDPNDRRAIGLQLTEAGRKLSAEIVAIFQELYDERFAAALNTTERRQVEASLRKVRALGFKLPETDFRLRRAQQFPIWKD
ncbi:MAG TPA: MarR family transcriptional regulator [Dehalococcoidia bacterium]|nr:MarR family transcriptional regulator [Dehalococcoidia bacterium]